MKYIKSILMGAACALTLTGCNDWLDVNSNPNSPTNDDVAYFQRLAHIEFYTNSAAQFAGMRTNMGTGDWTMNSRTSTYGQISQWQMNQSPSTSPYQWFFVGACCNVQDMINSAEAAGAYHYIGVAYIIRAYGFMLMEDLYGEMPYTEAVSTTNVPKYDNGKTIFKGVLDELDLGIEYLSREQDKLAQPLAAGDYWGGGDVQKWIKFANLLKARNLVKLSKKGAGSAADLKYDAQAILDALAKGPQSNNDNMVINHTDANSSTHDVLGWDEPVDYSPLYSVIGMNSNYYVTRMLYDNLTNFAGNGVEDPRADKILPWACNRKSDDSPAEMYGQAVKWVETPSGYSWRRTVGVDMNTTIRTENAPYTTSWTNDGTDGAKKQVRPESSPIGYYCAEKERAGDTIFVHQRNGSKGYYGGRSLLMWLDNKKGSGNDYSAISGTFMTRVSSPGWLSMYHEACFIKAEVLFNKGDKAGAFAAYKEGVKANIEMMNKKLAAWQAESNDKQQNECPSFTIMEDADIQNYLDNGIGTAADITLAHIMTQKHIAMMFMGCEQWNDMRRYDYDENVFFNFHVPAEVSINATTKSQLTNKDGKFVGPRRWMQCSHEINYNIDNLNAIAPEVPGAVIDGDGNWQNAINIYSVPVWWDTND